MPLRSEVARALERHGVAPAPNEEPASLRERLNERYLEDVRALRERRRAGRIAARDYAAAAEDLKRAYPLLGLPLELWSEPSPAGPRQGPAAGDQG